jgi:hypothetical protein
MLTSFGYRLTFLIVLLAAVCSLPTAALQKFMGFYSVDQPKDMAGWANSFYSTSIAQLVDGKSQYGLTQQLLFVPQFLTYEANNYRLVPDWQNIIATEKALWTTLLRNGTIVGFFLGDELMWNGLPYAQLTAWSSAMREAFPSSFIWENEAFPVYSCDPRAPQPQSCPAKFGPCCSYGQVPINITNGIPPGLNVTSVDIYRWNPKEGSIVAKVQQYYKTYLEPRLHAGQRLFVVPGADSSTHNSECDPSCYDSMCAGDAASFAEWIAKDSVIVGAMPWAWESCGNGCIPSHDEIGCKHMNLTRKAWAAAGEKIRKLPF